MILFNICFSLLSAGIYFGRYMIMSGLAEGYHFDGYSLSDCIFQFVFTVVSFMISALLFDRENDTENKELSKAFFIFSIIITVMTWVLGSCMNLNCMFIYNTIGMMIDLDSSSLWLFFLQIFEYGFDTLLFLLLETVIKTLSFYLGFKLGKSKFLNQKS